MTRSALTPAATVVFLTAAAAPLAAQNGARLREPAQVRRAVETITESDVRRRIGILADDSMRGRDTPSRELEEVAAYIAGEFRRFGLRPGGDSATFFQRYPIRMTRIDTSSYLMAMARGAHGHWMLGREARYAGGVLPDGPVSGPVVLMGIPADTSRPFGDADVSGAVIVQFVPASAVQRRVLGYIARAAAAGAKAWLYVSDRPAAQFAALALAGMRPRLERPGAPQVPIPIFEIRDSSAATVFLAAGEDPAALRAGPFAARRVGAITVTINVPKSSAQETSAPNVIGVLEGSDPVLRNEYVFFTAHMDHVGVGQPVNGDSIYNGADDDASGTTGVVELAEAFATLSPRPRRSLVFMTVSGEEKGLWGSSYYVDHPEVPLASTVADLNMDMIGRNWRDTIAVIGKEHSTLGEVANRVAQEHPELSMHLVDDLWPNENFYRRSDHFNFARKGVPILFFFNGTHPDYHRPSDSVDKIDAEKESRIIRMVFYVGLQVANAAERPQWNPESRRRIVEAAGN